MVVVNGSASTFADCIEQEECEPRVYLVVVYVISTKNRGIQIYWNKFNELQSLLSECELIA